MMGNGMMGRCIEMMNSMTGGGMIFVVLAALLVFLLAVLAVIGGLGFWAVRRFRQAS